MKDIIINQPHLQSYQQKCGAWFISVLSWGLWLYFLLPLFTLGGWFLGVKNLSDEIRWFGGYKTLLQMLELYGEIIIVIALLWLVWVIYLNWLHAGDHPKAEPTVTDLQLSKAFNIDLVVLERAKACQNLTVHFDEHAVITVITFEDLPIVSNHLSDLHKVVL